MLVGGNGHLQMSLLIRSIWTEHVDRILVAIRIEAIAVLFHIWCCRLILLLR